MFDKILSTPHMFTRFEYSNSVKTYRYADI